MTEHKVEDSDALLTGSYTYSYGVLSLKDRGSKVPFELSVDGESKRVEYQTIAEK